MLFIIQAADKPDSLALRMATRPAHFDYLKETDKLRLGGPFLDEGGNMSGSLMIVEAADLADAEAFAAGDPYAKAGLFESVRVTPWKATINLCGAAL